MVFSLHKLEDINEFTLLCGHICTLLGKYDEAEKYFLQSSQPVEALYLRRDLMQWVQALSLAQNLKPEEIPFIAREYAQQLEFTYENISVILFIFQLICKHKYVT